MNIEKVRKPRQTKQMSEETKELLKQKRAEKRTKAKENANNIYSLAVSEKEKEPEALPTQIQKIKRVYKSKAQKAEEQNPVPPQLTTLQQNSNDSDSISKKLTGIENILLLNNRELNDLKLLKQQKNKIKEQKAKLKEIKNKVVDKVENENVSEQINEQNAQLIALDYSALFR
jgi:hypothetical protein